MNPIKSLCIFCAVVAAGLVSCRQAQPQTEPTEVAPPTPELAAAAPDETEEPTLLTSGDIVGAKTLTEGESLESGGPWMMMRTSTGFLFVDSNATEFGFIPIPPPFTSGWAHPAPTGGKVGLVFSNSSENLKELQVFSLIENRVIYEQDLLAYQGESLTVELEQKQAAEDFELDRKTAVGRLAWSSDGKQLAFVSSHLGPSPDVYVLDIETEEVTQITSDRSHEVGLDWAPGDVYIFFAGVDKLFVNYAGSGFSGWNFYAARPDGSEVIDAGEGLQNRGGEAVVGWYADNQVLMVSGYGTCGLFDLRRLDIESGETQMVWEGQLDGIAYAPESKQVLVWQSALPPKSKECGSKSEAGLYRLDLPGGSPEKILEFPENAGVTANYSEAGNIFMIEVSTPGMPSTWMTVEENGTIEEFSFLEPVFSPDGSKYALIGSEAGSLQVYRADGKRDVLIQLGEVVFPTWTPDGTALFFFYRGYGSEDFSLFYWTRLPDIKMDQVTPDFYKDNDDEPIWVLP